MFQWLPYLVRCQSAPPRRLPRRTVRRASRIGLQSVAIVAFVAATGCSTWSATTVTELPIPRMPHTSIALEVAFVRVAPKQPLDQLWQQVDEQHLDQKIRRNLTENGIRSGVMGAQLPTELQELMASTGREKPSPSGESLLTDSATAPYRKLQNRPGEPSELIVVPEIAERKVVLFREEGRVRAEAFDEGQALLVVRGYPSGDGTVRVELLPEIKHGDIKQQWVPGNGTFLYDAARETKTFDQLRLSAVLSPGQTLLITGTDEARGLGGLLFVRGAGESSERLILLLRLAQTQYDDLFAPEQAAQPLVTPLN